MTETLSSMTTAAVALISGFGATGVIVLGVLFTLLLRGFRRLLQTGR